MLNIDLQDHRPLREGVYKELKFQILTGKITPGTRMMEVELAEEMGVSRTPIREAIRKLEKEGLVSIEPRKGAYATDISVNDMVDTLEVRENLEGLAAALAARKMTKEQLEELSRICEGYNGAIKNNETEKIIHYDEMFHKYIVTCTGNKILIKLSETVNEHVLRFRYLYYNDFSRYKNMPAEHMQIIEAIKSGSGPNARDVAGKHINRLKEFVIREGEGSFNR